MCGIAGIYGIESSKNKLSILLAPIEHRGESAYLNEERFLENKMAIDMHRLAIVDEFYGNQPSVNDDETVYCVFNGEIYNHESLRNKLSSDFQFRSNCDSEVVLNAYLFWGEEFVQHLDGKFGIGIIDLRKNKLLLARDPMGVKPLYYMNLPNNSWAFASEIKSLAALNKETDLKNTIFSLSPGSYWINGRETAYFKTNHFNSEKTDDIASLSLLKEKLRNAVAKRIPKHAKKIACLLSGGIDSTILTYLAAQQHPSVVAYTLNMEGSNSNDLKAAEQLCNLLKIEHKVVSPPKEKMQEFFS